MAVKAKNKGGDKKIKAKRNMGAPPKFETPEALQRAIQDYFDRGVRVRKVTVGPANNRTVVKIPVPTITGLCYHIGFASRQSFYDLEKREEFSYTVKRARLFIEREYEEQLSLGNCTGAIFALKNMGWMDKQELNHTGDLTIVRKEYKEKDK